MGKNWTITSLALIFAMGAHGDGIGIDLVAIGDVGNGADGNGRGAVGYQYSIGRTEISVDQFNDSGIVPVNPDGPDVGGLLSGSQPAVNVTFHEAARFCNFLTSGNYTNGAYAIDLNNKVVGINRALALGAYTTVYALPTEDEWYKAAYYTGSGYSQYANGLGLTPINETDAVFDRNDIDGPWDVTSGTPEQNGTLNMGGNVWEWLETADSSESSKQVFRGGSYYQGITFLDKSETGNSEFPDSSFFNTGFRIVAIPEPGTISLMSLSTIGIFLTRSLRRRRRLGSTLLPARCEPRCDTALYSKYEVDPVAQEQDQVNLSQMIVSQLRQTALALRNRYSALDEAFWNYMVNSYDRRVAKRQMFITNLRKKTLDCFDAFLSLIMK